MRWNIRNYGIWMYRMLKVKFPLLDSRIECYRCTMPWVLDAHISIYGFTYEACEIHRDCISNHLFLVRLITKKGKFGWECLYHTTLLCCKGAYAIKCGYRVARM